MPKVKKIYVWTNLVRPKWQPWSNTIAYYPLNYDFTDKSWNWYNLTVSNATISSVGEVPCAYYNWGRAYNTSAPVGTQRTLSAWVYNPWTSWVIIWSWANQTSYYAIMLALSSWNIQISDFYSIGYAGTTPSQNARHHVVAVADNATMKVYLDGVLKASWTHTRTDSSTGVSVWWKPYTDQYPDLYTWYISNAIIENVAWSDSDILNYYNLTKWNYWF